MDLFEIRLVALVESGYREGLGQGLAANAIAL